jgi:methyl-accepting chemotaxis protein
MGFRSFRAKLVGMLLAIGIVPLAVVGVLAYWQSSQTLGKRGGDRMFLIAEGVVDTIDRNLFERYGDAQAFAANPAARASREIATQTANFLIKNYGFYDLIVIADASGQVVAVNTVNNEGRPIDSAKLIGRSVSGQPWFEQCINGSISQAKTYIQDLGEDPWVAEVYGTRGLALNFSAAIRDETGQAVGVWSNRASWDRTAQQVMRDRAAMLKDETDTSVEYQIVRKDGVLLDDADPNAILKFNLAEAGLEAARQITQGGRGHTQEVHKRRKVEQLNGYASSKGFREFPGYGWGVLVREDLAAATADAHSLRTFILVLGLVTTALIIGASFLVARGIATSITGALQVVEAVTAASTELTDVSSQMSANAEETSAQAGVVSGASDQVSKNIETLAASTQEMTASIGDISKNSSEAAQVAKQAVTIANSANVSVRTLGDSSAEISQVIKVITSIAQQTNLLALNATIEAARAGEAGKGFAVVANEVKELAEQTTQATESIRKKIEAIQSDSKGAVTAIVEIGNIINKISDFSTTVASAVEQQTATTDQISRNIEDVARSSSEIAQNISGVAIAAQSTSGGASKTSQCARSLAEMASQLQELVARFR